MLCVHLSEIYNSSRKEKKLKNQHDYDAGHGNDDDDEDADGCEKQKASTFGRWQISGECVVYIYINYPITLERMRVAGSQRAYIQVSV